MGRNQEENVNRLYDQEGGRKKKSSGLLKVFFISLFCVLAVTGISGGLIYRFGHDMYTNVNYVADEDIKVVDTLPQQATEEELSTEEAVGVKVDDSTLSGIHDLMSSFQSVDVHEGSEDIYNILLIGVDRRDKTWNGNSDSMILVSIDKSTNRMVMTSFMRDLYVDIPEKGYKKLNSAYAYGGGPLLCQTITDTFKIKVDRYVAVDFVDLVNIIDTIGGVTLDVTDEEIKVVNGYIWDMCENIVHVDPEEHYFGSAGTYYCDGVQTVCYARNRFVGNNDFERTSRQRYVLEQLMKEVKQMSLAQMTEKVQAILKFVTMNVPEKEIWEMIPEVPDFLEYKIDTVRIPYDNMYDTIYVGGQDMLVPYWESTIRQLQEEIYGSTTAAEKASES